MGVCFIRDIIVYYITMVEYSSLLLKLTIPNPLPFSLKAHPEKTPLETHKQQKLTHTTRY